MRTRFRKGCLGVLRVAPGPFPTEETLTASHLLKKASSEQEFEQQEQAVKVLREKIEKGMDFADAVRLESDDAGNDGNLGTFGKGRMVPEFEQAAFSGGGRVEPTR